MHRGSLSVLCLSIFLYLEYVAAKCGPQQTLYYDPEETQSPRCCQEGGTVTWQDQAAKIGFCCAPGHEWTGDISSGEGGCCPIGMLMIEGMCVDGDSPEAQKAKSKSEGGSGCGCHHHSSNDGGEETLMPATHGHAEISDEEEMDFENNGIVDMKIRYGQCYRLVTVPSGKEIGSNRENTIYTPGGLFQGIPFRVCRSTRDCSGGRDPEADIVLSSKSRFYLQDQMGRYNDPSATPGWVSSSTRGVLKTRFTKDQTEATSFVGALSKANPHWCEDGFESGGCGMALRLSSVPVVLQFSPIDCFEDDHSGSEASRDGFHRRVEDEL